MHRQQTEQSSTSVCVRAFCIFFYLNKYAMCSVHGWALSSYIGYTSIYNIYEMHADSALKYSKYDEYTITTRYYKLNAIKR